MYPFDLTQRPTGFDALDSEPVFEASKHLQLEQPTDVYGLDDLNYDAETIAQAPAKFAATSVFRVLSDEGAALLYETVKRLEPFATSNARIERCVRGGVYRSRFLRDLCLSPDITDFLSDIAGLDLMPHTIPHQLGHLNYNPQEIGKNVDKWHVDTLRFDYVMFVTDPTKNEGGQFQYFKGTKEEMAQLKASGQLIPEDKIISPDMPGPGYAVLQQGNLVVHQAKGLTAPGERVTMVNGYVPRDPNFPDYSRYDQLANVDPAHVVTSEYSRHAALQAQRLLDQNIINIAPQEQAEDYAQSLEAAAQSLLSAAQNIRAGAKSIEHFGD